MGVVCANYGRTRGTSKVCRSVWHAGCYSQDDRDRFPILEAGDLDDALLDTEGHGELEDDENRFKEARDGDHLMCPFQCDSCTFYNLKGRYAREDSEQDMLLAVCIRRAILDSFWSRERSTVEKNTREMKNLRNLGESIGLDEPLPERGPFPIGDTQGVGIASLMLMKTLSVGKRKTHTIRDGKKSKVSGVQFCSHVTRIHWIVDHGRKRPIIDDVYCQSHKLPVVQKIYGWVSPTNG